MFYSPTPNKTRYGIFIEDVKAKAIEMMATATSDTVEKLWADWVAEPIPVPPCPVQAGELGGRIVLNEEIVE